MMPENKKIWNMKVTMVPIVRDEELRFNDRRIKPNPPEVGFDTRMPSSSEIKLIVMAA